MTKDGASKKHTERLRDAVAEFQRKSAPFQTISDINER